MPESNIKTITDRLTDEEVIAIAEEIKTSDIGLQCAICLKTNNAACGVDINQLTEEFRKRLEATKSKDSISTHA